MSVNLTKSEALVGSEDSIISILNFHGLFPENENHFTIPIIIHVDLAIFLNRLIGIFETLMKNLEFAAIIYI